MWGSSVILVLTDLIVLTVYSLCTHSLILILGAHEITSTKAEFKLL